MEVNKPDALTPASHGGKQTPGRDDSGDRDDGPDDDAGDDEDARKEAFQVDDSLEEAIPPRIQQMLNDLADQLEPLRRDLDASRVRERELRERLERHPYLPVLNRQGLEHELSRVVGHIQGLGSAAFICVFVANAEHIRMTYGRDACEKAMAHACSMVQDVVGATDIVGCLGGHDLGVLLLAPGDGPVDGLWRKLQDIMPDRLFSSGSSSLALDIAIGGVSLEREHTFSQAIQAADADLMSRRRGC